MFLLLYLLQKEEFELKASCSHILELEEGNLPPKMFGINFIFPDKTFFEHCLKSQKISSFKKACIECTEEFFTLAGCVTIVYDRDCCNSKVGLLPSATQPWKTNKQTQAKK